MSIQLKNIVALSLLALLGAAPTPADDIFLYLEGKLLRLSTEVESMVEIADMDIQVTGFTFTPDGELWAVTDRAAIYRVDTETGATAEILPPRAEAPYDFYRLQVLPDHTIYIIEGLSSVVRIDAVTGAESLLTLHPALEPGQSYFLDALDVVDGQWLGIGRLYPEDQTYLFAIGGAGGSVVPIRPWAWPDQRPILELQTDSSGHYWIRESTGGGVIGIPGYHPFNLSAFDAVTGDPVDKPIYEMASIMGQPATFAIRPTPEPEGCRPSATELCFLNGRFRVTASWRNAQGVEGAARRAHGSSDQAGLLWFFSEDNWELTLKVLDGCDINSHYWFFLSGTTNVAFTVTVTDTLTGSQRTYSNPLGQAAMPVADVEALDGCP